MAVVINGNGTVTGLTALPSSAMATGSVVQVQSVTKTDDFSVSANSTPQDVTGLTVNITPTSSSNKILLALQWHPLVLCYLSVRFCEICEIIDS